MAKSRAQRLRRKQKAAAKSKASNKKAMHTKIKDNKIEDNKIEDNKIEETKKEPIEGEDTKNDDAKTHDAGNKDGEPEGIKPQLPKGRKSTFEGPRLMHHRQSRPRAQRLERFRLPLREGPSFIHFLRLPVEIQIIIWQHAMKAEAKRTVAVFDSKSGALMPTAHLVSSISFVCKLAKKLADEFYSLNLEVFLCYRSTAALIPEYLSNAKGVLRLNLDYTTLILGFDPLWYNMIEPDDEILCQAALYKWHGGGPPDARRKVALKYKLHHVSRTRLTACLTEGQCAQVKRIYELADTPFEVCGWEPPCCWGCSWDTEWCPAEASYARAQFPNVWLCRLLVMTDVYDPDDFMDDYAELGADDLWENLALKLVTCDEPRVHRLGDDFEVAPEPEFDSDEGKDYGTWRCWEDDDEDDDEDEHEEDDEDDDE